MHTARIHRRYPSRGFDSAAPFRGTGQRERVPVHPELVEGRRCNGRNRRGQSMVEYSMVTWLLMVALIIGSTVQMIPQPGGGTKNVIEMFLNAYQTYYESFYFVLNQPFP